MVWEVFGPVLVARPSGQPRALTFYLTADDWERMTTALTARGLSFDVAEQPSASTP
jgi:hypothetical protein